MMTVGKNSGSLLYVDGALHSPTPLPRKQCNRQLRGTTLTALQFPYLRISFFFFFSSRRRHTRWPRDWSSDVCSSDLLDDGSTSPVARSNRTYSVGPSSRV